jgi:hypothetical protein
MSDPTESVDEEPESETTLGDNPFMHVDYRVFEVSVHGGAEDTVEDVNEVMEERLNEALEQIEDLKRTDFELDDEFDIDRSGGPGGMMTQ